MFATSRDAFHCEVLRAADVGAAIALVARAFSADERLGVAVGVTAAEMVELIQPAAARVVADGLTVVARDAASGELAGVLITDDFASLLPMESEGMSPKFDPIFGLLGRLDEAYREARTIAPGEHLHLFMLATEARYRGRGVAGRLARACLANGGRLGIGMR